MSSHLGVVVTHTCTLQGRGGSDEDEFNSGSGPSEVQRKQRDGNRSNMKPESALHRVAPWFVCFGISVDQQRTLNFLVLTESKCTSSVHYRDT